MRPNTAETGGAALCIAAMVDVAGAEVGVVGLEEYTEITAVQR